jgi:hypothetical protein
MDAPYLINNIWQAARTWTLKVFFLPEPGGMLMLSTGLGLLVVLIRASRWRWRQR